MEGVLEGVVGVALILLGVVAVVLFVFLCWGLVWKVLLSRLGLFRELFSNNNGNKRRGDSLGRLGSGQGQDGATKITTAKTLGRVQQRPFSSQQRSVGFSDATATSTSSRNPQLTGVQQRRMAAAMARASKSEAGEEEEGWREGFGDDQDSGSSVTSSVSQSDEHLLRR